MLHKERPENHAYVFFRNQSHAMDLTCYESMPSPEELEEMLRQRVKKAEILQVYPAWESTPTDTVYAAWELLGCTSGRSALEKCQDVAVTVGRDVRAIFWIDKVIV
tara:strand:+ start:77 stop:394 length:318 start_codon:yes stop_codon:yes gene_type:complete